MRSWTYLIRLVGVNEQGETKQEEALYIVAVPTDKNLFKEMKYNCYAEHYLPEESAVNYGQAYALGVDFDIKDLEKYGLNFFNEDYELYIFREGIPMKEGLKNVYRLLMDKLRKEGFGKDFEVIKDLGAPSLELMHECLTEAIKNP